MPPKRQLTESDEALLNQPLEQKKSRRLKDNIRQRAITQAQTKSDENGIDCTTAIKQINECVTRDQLDKMDLNFECKLGHSFQLRGTSFTNVNSPIKVLCRGCTPIKIQLRNTIKDGMDNGIISITTDGLKEVYSIIGKAPSSDLYVTYVDLTLCKCSHRDSYSLGQISILPDHSLANLKCHTCSSSNTDTAGFNHIKNGLEYCMNHQLLQITKDEIDAEIKKLVGTQIRDMEKHHFISKCSNGHPFNVYCATFRKFENKLEEYFKDACKSCHPPLYSDYLGHNLESFKNKFNIDYLDDTDKLLQTKSLATLLDHKLTVLTACKCKLTIPLKSFLRKIDWSEFNWECYLHHPTTTASDICDKVKYICTLLEINPESPHMVSTLNKIKSESIILDYFISIKLNCNGTILLSAQTIHKTPVERLATLLPPCSSCSIGDTIIDSMQHFINLKSTIFQINQSDILKFKKLVYETAGDDAETLFNLRLPIKSIKCGCLIKLSGSSFYYNDYLLYNQCFICNFQPQKLGEMGYNLAPPSKFNKMGLHQELICEANHSILIMRSKTIDSICNTCFPGSRKYENIFCKGVTKFIQYLNQECQHVQTRANVYFKHGDKIYYFDFQLGSNIQNKKLIKVTDSNGNSIILVIEIDERPHFVLNNQRDIKLTQLFSSNQLNQKNGVYYLLRISEHYLNLFTTFNEKVEKVSQCLANVYGIILDGVAPDTRVFVSDPIYFNYFVKKGEALELPLTPLYSIADIMCKISIDHEDLVAEYLEKSSTSQVKVSNLKLDTIFSFIHSGVQDVPRLFEFQGAYGAMVNDIIIIIASNNNVFNSISQLLKSDGDQVKLQVLLVPIEMQLLVEQLLKLLYYCMSNNQQDLFNFISSSFRYLASRMNNNINNKEKVNQLQFSSSSTK